MPALLARLVPVALIALNAFLILYAGVSVYRSIKGQQSHTKWILPVFGALVLVIITMSLYSSAG